MEGSKRKGPDETTNGTAEAAGAIVSAQNTKRQKTGKELSLASEERTRAITTTVQRTSSLQAPIMLLTGHKAEVYSIKFSPSGKHIVSGSFDKSLYLWNVYGDCDNYMVLRGHASAVLEVHWSTGEDYIFSASADKSTGVWDVPTGQRLKKCKGHLSFVNTCCPARRGPPILASGSDDCTVKLWDIRVKSHLHSIDTGFPVTAVCFSDQSDQVYAGGIDNTIKGYDIRMMKEATEPFITLEGHTDSITGLRLSPEGNYLLTNAMDNTVRIWDIRPYVEGHRNIKIFQGVQHNFEKTLLKCSWSADGTKVSAGSADRFVYVWDTATTRILYKLPGHRGTVNEVDFHPKEPIIGSASSDTTIYLGEIKP